MTEQSAIEPDKPVHLQKHFPEVKVSYQNFERSRQSSPFIRKTKEVAGSLLLAAIILWIFFAMFVTGCTTRLYKCVNGKVHYRVGDGFAKSIPEQECVKDE